MTCAQMTCASTATPALPQVAGTPLAWPPTGRQIAAKPAGGFLKCPTDFLTLPWWLYQDGHLPFLALRTWYGVLELRERRYDCAPDTAVHYGVEELRQLLHVPRLAPVQAALRTLEDAGLLTWSASSIQCLPEPDAVRDREIPGYQALQAQLPAWRTWVPAPRRLLRWLARDGTPGLCATAAGVLLRCLWSKGRQCVSSGRVAATWIAAGFGLAERTVQRALEGLQACGWLARLPSTSAQDAAYERQYGGRTVVNLAWDVPCPCAGEHAAAATPLPGRHKPTTARQEESVEHFERLDPDLSPTPLPADQNMSPIPAAIMTLSPGKTGVCGRPSGLDFYPFQEETPDWVPASREPEVRTGICLCEQHEHEERSALLPTPLPILEFATDSFPQDEHPSAQAAAEAPVAAPLPLPPAAPSPSSLGDPAAAFAALPAVVQEEQLHAATVRLLAQGLRAELLIRPVLLAEVYAQMAPPPPVGASGGDRCGVPTAAPLAAAPCVEAPAACPPRLSRVVPTDLRDGARLEALRQQAIARGWLSRCEADRLNFVASAVHAQRVGTDPCALFVALVHTQRWEVITQDDEDQARGLLRERSAHPSRQVVAASMRALSDDVRFVRLAQHMLRQEGWQDDPFLAVTRQYPSWTRARWDAALAELMRLPEPVLERSGGVVRRAD